MSSKTAQVTAYVAERTGEADPDTLLSFFTPTGTIVTEEKKTFSGSELRNYFATNPPPAIGPTVSAPRIVGENVVITLKFLMLKSYEITFEFDDLLFKKVTIVSRWF